MRAPIIVENDGDVLIFDSLVKAETYLEPIDVENDEYLAFDRQGRKLDLGVEGLKVVIRSGEAEPAHREDLTRYLRAFLEAVGFDRDWCRSAGLEALIEAGLKHKTE